MTPFIVHRIDPVIGTVLGAHLWWYGLSYTLGFLNAHLFLRRHRAQFGLSLRSIYSLTLCLAVGVLLGGRLLVVFDHEWVFYRDHPSLIPAVWLGGMATHGLLLGGFAGVMAFCIWKRLPFRQVFDALAIPAAIIMGCGRLGNFIDGQIVGSLTSVPWAVQFPEAEGFRHPVVLYDGTEELSVDSDSLWAKRRGAPPGRLAALFVFCTRRCAFRSTGCASIRSMRSACRPARATTSSWPAIGLVLLIVNWARHRGRLGARSSRRRSPVCGRVRGARGLAKTRLRRAAVFVLVIPSDATRDIPSRYGHRHPNLTYTAMYPKIPR
jgi:phosphatidylglycerol:prolipoprotein diacylglycerol transferase